MKTLMVVGLLVVGVGGSLLLIQWFPPQALQEMRQEAEKLRRVREAAEEIARMEQDKYVSPINIRACVTSDVGNVIAGYDPNSDRAVVWEAGGRVRFSTKLNKDAERPPQLHLSPTGKYLIINGISGALPFAQVYCGKSRIGQIRYMSEGGNRFCFSRDEKYLASDAGCIGEPAKAVFIWQLDAGEMQRISTIRHTSDIFEVAFSRKEPGVVVIRDQCNHVGYRVADGKRSTPEGEFFNYLEHQ